MRNDRKDRAPESVPMLQGSEAARRPQAGHVVFDFTGLERPDVGDLSLILTARLQSAPRRAAGSATVRLRPASAAGAPRAG